VIRALASPSIQPGLCCQYLTHVSHSPAPVGSRRYVLDTEAYCEENLTRHLHVPSFSLENAWFEISDAGIMAAETRSGISEWMGTAWRALVSPFQKETSPGRAADRRVCQSPVLHTTSSGITWTWAAFQPGYSVTHADLVRPSQRYGGL
jgi:hypothetical protein